MPPPFLPYDHTILIILYLCEIIMICFIIIYLLWFVVIGIFIVYYSVIYYCIQLVLYAYEINKTNFLI